MISCGDDNIPDPQSKLPNGYNPQILEEIMHDPYNLQRFVAAQDEDGMFEQACEELRQGQKSGHWIWFIFPQLRGLGRSDTSNFFGIAGREETEAYLNHVTLGPRLRECSRLTFDVNGRSAVQIFGSDSVKFHASMTLFSEVGGRDNIFSDSLQKYFRGQRHQGTSQKL